MKIYSPRAGEAYTRAATGLRNRSMYMLPVDGCLCLCPQFSNHYIYLLLSLRHRLMPKRFRSISSPHPALTCPVASCVLGPAYSSQSAPFLKESNIPIHACCSVAQNNCDSQPYTRNASPLSSRRKETCNGCTIHAIHNPTVRFCRTTCHPPRTWPGPAGGRQKHAENENRAGEG